MPDESLPAYAERLARHVGDQPVVLGGVSFGGMLAVEMGRHLPNVRAVVLIGSSTTGRALTRLARAGAHALLRAPRRLLRPPRLLWPAIHHAFGATRKEDRALLDHLIASAPAGFVKWGLRAILDWAPDSLPPCPVRQIHGDADLLISPRRVPADTLVPGAGHLVSVTHPAEVNAFLEDAVARYAAPDGG